MCGIAGFVGHGERETLEKMTRELAHRGPDDEGFYFRDGLGLGQRRLSIIDIEAGHQPMSNEDGKIQVVYNGEIYNHQELKDELGRSGHKFLTNCDTEVIVHGYEEWGTDCFKKFNGMFAVAVWDEDKKSLVLARDRYGQKPLYWIQSDDAFIFGSEMKAILKHPKVKKELNNLAIYQFFCFDYVPQPLTVFKDIYKLANGCFLVFKDGEVRVDKYYQVDMAKKDISLSSALNDLEQKLEDSVYRRLMADVPLGIFLSGGIDSSTIAYFAKKQKDDIKTFSIGFKEKSFDESPYARQVADFLRTDHYHKEFTPKDLIDVIPEITSKLDEPFGDPSILPTYLLSRFTRENVKVALGGDGGDELLMGYPNHQVQKMLKLSGIYRLRFKGNYAKVLERALPVSDKNLTFFYKVARYAESVAFPALERDFLNIGAYFKGIDDLFRFNTKPGDLFGFSRDFLGEYKEHDYLSKVNLVFLKYYLQDDILFKVDRASMYNSLEVRAPFLDFELADFVNALPLSFKLRGFKTKYLLKKLMEDKLPKDIVYRKKKGFGVPLTRWLKNELKDYMFSILSLERIRKFGLLNYDMVERLVGEHLAGQRDNRKILWNLIVFQNWCERYLE